MFQTITHRPWNFVELQRLLNSGIHPDNEKASNGSTLLMAACAGYRRGDEKFIELLLTKGALGSPGTSLLDTISEGIYLINKLREYIAK